MNIPVMSKTLYLSRTGMLEPLGQSQVLSYLRGLSREFEVTLISFERSEHLREADQLARIEELCASHGIRWVRKRYLQRPRVMASALNLLSLFFVTWREARRSGARLIHARSYVPAAAGWAVSRLSGIPYIFDMRSLWPEELVTSKRMRRGSWLHKLIFAAEGRLLRDAAAIVSLTRAALPYLNAVHPGALWGERVRVIPTCTDLERFRPLGPAAKEQNEFVVSCHGSLTNGWFDVSALAQVFSRLAEARPEARFEVITRDRADLVLARLGGAQNYRDRLSIYPARAAEIHEKLQRHSLSVFFYVPGATSELGRSPTRMGEALACGIPVLTTYGVGDVAKILRDDRVGVVLDALDHRALTAGLAELDALMKDPELSGRCRRVAESIYSLESGTKRYAGLYHDLLDGAPAASR